MSRPCSRLKESTPSGVEIGLDEPNFFMQRYFLKHSVLGEVWHFPKGAQCGHIVDAQRVSQIALQAHTFLPALNSAGWWEHPVPFLTLSKAVCVCTQGRQVPDNSFAKGFASGGSRIGKLLTNHRLGNVQVVVKGVRGAQPLTSKALTPSFHHSCQLP